MNSHQSLQTLFSNVIQAILTKIALDYKLSLSELTNKISTPTITDDLEGSILSYCNSLADPIHTQSIPEKTKKIVKKKTVPAIADVIPDTNAVAETIVIPDTIVEKPKRVLKKKAALAITAVAETADADVVCTETAETAVVAQIAPPVVGEPIVSAVTEAIIMPEKPKKILKKKAAPVAVAETAETPVAATVAPDKPKKILKKKNNDVVSQLLDTGKMKEPESVSAEPVVAPIVKEIDTLEPEELKLKPKKIILKKPVLDSKKNVDQPEYGEDVEQAEPYESLEMYEDDSVEPKEFNGVKYYVDTSGYIYDFENQDLVGKLNQSGDSIILLNDFSPMSE